MLVSSDRSYVRADETMKNARGGGVIEVFLFWRRHPSLCSALRATTEAAAAASEPT